MCLLFVAPLVGAWIEITAGKQKQKTFLSLPSLERGLKSCNHLREHHRQQIAPTAGTWVEIHEPRSHVESGRVAPLVGEWVEIQTCSEYRLRF